jgi:hypothetical protein
MPYPILPTKPAMPSSKSASPAELPSLMRKYADDLELWLEEKAEYDKQLTEYKKHDVDLFNQFKTEALDDVGLLDHPKAEEAFTIACDFCDYLNLSSLHELLNALSDLIGNLK